MQQLTVTVPILPKTSNKLELPNFFFNPLPQAFHWAFFLLPPRSAVLREELYQNSRIPWEVFFEKLRTRSCNNKNCLKHWMENIPWKICVLPREIWQHLEANTVFFLGMAEMEPNRASSTATSLMSSYWQDHTSLVWPSFWYKFPTSTISQNLSFRDQPLLEIVAELCQIYNPISLKIL